MEFEIEKRADDKKYNTIPEWDSVFIDILHTHKKMTVKLIKV